MTLEKAQYTTCRGRFYNEPISFVDAACAHSEIPASTMGNWRACVLLAWYLALLKPGAALHYSVVARRVKLQVVDFGLLIAVLPNPVGRLTKTPNPFHNRVDSWCVWLVIRLVISISLLQMVNFRQFFHADMKMPCWPRMNMHIHVTNKCLLIGLIIWICTMMLWEGFVGILRMR